MFPFQTFNLITWAKFLHPHKVIYSQVLGIRLLTYGSHYSAYHMFLTYKTFSPNHILWCLADDRLLEMLNWIGHLKNSGKEDSKRVNREALCESQENIFLIPLIQIITMNHYSFLLLIHQVRIYFLRIYFWVKVAVILYSEQI